MLGGFFVFTEEHKVCSFEKDIIETGANANPKYIEKIKLGGGLRDYCP